MTIDDIKVLIDELNELEQQYGRVLVERDPNYDPSGEANARILLLKQELAQIGVKLQWTGSEYEIVGSDESHL